MTSVAPDDNGYRVATSNGDIRCRRVVLASGACNRPSVPAVRDAVPAVDRSSVTPFDYRNPDQLPEGGVLVVGASATGVQLADEIHRSGRPVTLSVGEHVRLPRTYRGRDVLWWMDASGVWNQRYDEIDDLTRARRLPSPQLVGTPERDDARPQCAQRERRRARRPAVRGPRRPGAVFRRAAESVRAGGSQDGPAAGHVRRVGARRKPRSTTSAPPERFEPTRVPASSPLHLDLRAARSARLCGRPGSVPTTAGWTSRWSIARAICGTRAGRGRSGTVRDRAAYPSPPQIDVHPRRRRRRTGYRGTSRELSCGEVTINF